MQKRIFIFLFFLFTFLSYSTFAEAALQFLPRYQGGYGVRSQEGGKDKVTVTCASRGGVEKGANQTCTGAFTAGDKTCYKSCACNNGYKANALGGCVAKACADYGLKSSPDITQNCSQVSKAPSLTCFECIACDTSVYKYNCSGTGYAAAQSGMTCNKLYSECKCAANYRWDKASGKCICDGDYTVDDNGVCNLKVCEDYNLSASEDTAKNCIQSSPRSGLSCWACIECDSSYQYECLSVSNAGGGDGESCGGRYKKCSCDSLYKWEDGSCVLGCTRNSCSASDFPLSSRSAVNAVSYEECTPSCSDESPRYKVSACASGYDVKPNGSGCEEKPSTCAQYSSGNTWKWYCCKEGKNYVAEIDFASSDVQSSRMKPQTFNSTYASVCPSGYRLPTLCELGYAKYVMGISALNNKLSLEGKSPLKTSDSYSSSQGIWYYTSGVDKNYPSRHIVTATDRSGEAAPSGDTSSYVDVYGSYIRCVKDN